MSTEREIGQHDEAIETLKQEFKLLRTDVTEIKEMMAQGKGAFKVLLWLGGLVAGVLGAIGGFVGRLLDHAN